MSLALFDLDNTLIAGDSAQLFSEYLAQSHLPTPDNFLDVNAVFMADYDVGQLDLPAYMRYTLSPLSQLNPEELRNLVNSFLDKTMPGILLPKAHELVSKHRNAGDDLVIVSATGSHLVYPIAERLNIPHALAVDVEVKNDFLTGEISGIPTFREGKVTRVQQWAKSQAHEIKHATFYSDSLNDLPLLEMVKRPIAVDPDPVLEEMAVQKNWEIISLR